MGPVGQVVSKWRDRRGLPLTVGEDMSQISPYLVLTRNIEKHA